MCLKNRNFLDVVLEFTRHSPKTPSPRFIFIFSFYIYFCVLILEIQKKKQKKKKQIFFLKEKEEDTHTAGAAPLTCFDLYHKKRKKMCLSLPVE